MQEALHELREECMMRGINWIVDADVCGFFDNIDRKLLMEFLSIKVKDKNVLRIIGKWLNCGVMEDGNLHYPETGTPQGGVISPLLANVFLHYVLDEWFVRDVQPRMRGHCFLIRFADDFIIGFQREDDARKVMEVLPKRFARYNLTIHPEKTKLVRFGKPPRSAAKSGNDTFDFLGFTHYWTKSLRGNWVVKRKTMQKRERRARRAIWTWCKWNRHELIPFQHKKLCQKLKGHYAYYAVRCNMRALERVYESAKKAWHYWLSRRTSDGYIRRDSFAEFLLKHPLPIPRIIHCF